MWSEWGGEQGSRVQGTRGRGRGAEPEPDRFADVVQFEMCRKQKEQLQGVYTNQTLFISRDLKTDPVLHGALIKTSSSQTVGRLKTSPVHNRLCLKGLF